MSLPEGIVRGEDGFARCAWGASDPLYVGAVEQDIKPLERGLFTDEDLAALNQFSAHLPSPSCYAENAVFPIEVSP